MTSGYAVNDITGGARAVDSKGDVSKGEHWSAEHPGRAVGFEDFRAAVQAHMDDSARSLGYDDIKTAATYADEPAIPRFQAEGAALRAWRSLVWAHCYEQLALVSSGESAQPAIEKFLQGLPALEMPTR